MSNDNDKDQEYQKNMGKRLRKIRKENALSQDDVADALLDRYEYAGSSIYSEYPDKVTILKIADMVYDKFKYREEQEMIQTNDEAMIRNPYFIEVSLRDGNSPFRTLIQVVLHWNINHRRQRYYRRQKVFSNR